MERSGVLWIVSKGPSNFTDFESAWTRTDLRNATTMVHDGQCHFVQLWSSGERVGGATRDERTLAETEGESARWAPSSRRGHPA